MSEDRFEMLLGPFVLGELTDEEERALQRHLEECPSCRNDLDELRAADGILRSAASGPPPELKDWVLARVRSERRPASGGRWRIWLPVAAAPDVLEGLLEHVGDARLIEGGHEVDRRAGWACKRPPAAVEVDPVQRHAGRGPEDEITVVEGAIEVFVTIQDNGFVRECLSLMLCHTCPSVITTKPHRTARGSLRAISPEFGLALVVRDTLALDSASSHFRLGTASARSVTLNEHCARPGAME